MARKDKMLAVVTETGRYHGAALTQSLEPGFALELPRFFRPSAAAPSADAGTPGADLERWPAAENQTVVVHFSMSDDLPAAAATNSLHAVLLRCRLTGVTELDRYRVRLNGLELLDAEHRCPAGVSSSRREFCHFAETPSPCLLKHLLKAEVVSAK